MWAAGGRGEANDLVSPHLDHNCYCQGNGLSHAELLDLFQNETTGAVTFYHP
jgi:hypothetical protein